MKIKLAILDHDETYLNQIVSIMDSKYMDSIQTYTFTSKDTAIKTVSEAKIDVFLANPDFEMSMEEIPMKCCFAYLVDQNDIERYKGQIAIGKYQKIQLFYQQILSMYAEKVADMELSSKNTKFSIPLYCFLSASGGTGSSSLAMAYAKNQAMHGKKVLYFNLEQLPTTGLVFTGEGNGNFSEIIYSIKSGRSNVTLKIESNTKQDNSEVFFFDSCNIPLDLLELDTNDFKQLLIHIASLNKYELVVVDLDFTFQKKELFVLEGATKIIFVSDGSAVANRKFLSAYESIVILDEQNETGIAPRISLVFNKFRNRTSQVLQDERIKVIGGIPYFEGADFVRVVDELSHHPLMNKLDN
ncbi:MAG: hypothetical protein PUC65_03665 [Clostridiales bacterium]|nr:hypothetical protein [Clostridiales bacterium]